MRRLGGCHPCKLQIAGCHLYEAKVAASPVRSHTVRRDIRCEIGRVCRVRQDWPRLLLERMHVAARWMVRIPQHLGGLAGRIGSGADTIRNWFVGVLILVLVGLVIVGVLRPHVLNCLLDPERFIQCVRQAIAR